MSGGAAVLYDATPNYLKNRVAKSYKNLVLDIVPLTESVLNLPFISFFVVCMVIPICFASFAHPKENSKIIELDEVIYQKSLNSGTLY